MCKKKSLKIIPVDKICNSTHFIPVNCDNISHAKHSWFDIETFDYESNITSKINHINVNVMRCKQIKVNANQIQKRILLDWIECARLVYNITVDYLKHHKIYNFSKLRSAIKSEFTDKFRSKLELSNIPCHVIDNSIKDVLKALKSAIALLKGGFIKRFRLRHKKQSKDSQTIVIEKQDFSKRINSFYVKRIGEIHTSEALLNNIFHDCRLTYYKNKSIFILYSPIERNFTESTSTYDTCGIDPGLKSFLTVYNPQGHCMKIMNRDRSGKLSRLIHKKLALLKQKRVRKSRLALLRNNRKIYNNVKELHYKTAKLISNTYDNIYLGKLSTQNIIKGKSLSPFEKQFALALSHYTFYCILKQKCEERAKTVLYVDESYTSKTCGCCGNIYNVSTSRVYNCSKCNNSFDRDMNSARLILIKNE